MIAIFKDNCPEDKVTDNYQYQVLDELGRVFCGIPKGELSDLRSFRKGSELKYVFGNKQSGQWLINVTVNHRLGSGARLKATDANNLA
jgi:hypothetical protein